MKKLYIDEVMALQLAAFPVEKILKTDLTTFDKLCNEYPELENYLDKANDILDRQEKLGIVTISCQDNIFPKRFLSIGSDCPPLIYCKGNLDLLNIENSVAIIGARSADREGNTKAYQLGKQYAEENHVVISGLALGCDTSAHQGCLDANGSTIAIVGNGLNLTHPKENKALEDLILVKGGLILSEQTVGIKANPTRLVARNRLQAALSRDVILAQCPAKSGSLHTMRFARKYGRSCFAATYPKRNEANAGNYMLIDEGLARAI